MEEAINTLFAPYYRALEVHSIDTKNANSANLTKRPLFLNTITYYIYIPDRRYIPEVEMKLIYRKREIFAGQKFSQMAPTMKICGENAGHSDMIEQRECLIHGC